ncbi:HAMP domain-containing sensor histidine kinase [Sulfuricurvum sp.]|uniref:sensor histidine kinase n=1 Tax=Sulfuricurvum sp. TaxID=2025608 RepID=UPI002629BB59|nr:HAMP domain-containing sensor histidine kinase [Sulfuricurvum sp.]MDD2266738.1 HAMP domain-containing sensor histidine kinase [Sulfuricurvum sp.]MDD2783906.1 HAMP domain-containing sensor histidine kinase [Sulfuricurvum sp.]
MRRWNNLPIVYKLFITLFGGIAIIIIALLSYLWGYESELMLNKEQDILHTQSVSVANDLKSHIERLQKEILFLSHLEVMDDMVVQDMDRRITSLLEQKADDLGESISLFMVSPDFTIHASSKSSLINTTFKGVHSIKYALKHHKSYFFLGDNLYLFTPAYGSFNTKEFLGYLVMSYPMKNFALRLKSDQNFYRWITPPSSLSFLYKNNSPILAMNSYLHDTITLDGVLEGWEFHYAMPKNETLSLLYHFQTLFLSAFGIGLALIGFLVWIIVLRIVKPLRELSNTAKSIAMTGDYSQTVTETGGDEIGMMAHSFNTLMSTTRLSMERIELLGKTQAALQAKSSFLSSMSHELRTPLGSILSLTQYMMIQPETPESMRETLGKIENSSHYLLGVINNILDLAKVESGKMEPHIAPCNPITLIEDALELVTPLAEDKGLYITTIFEPIETVLMSDARLLGQVVINLLSNAIKYTEKGYIQVQIQYIKDLYVLEVKDTGCGIAHEALDNLFDEFYQVRSQRQSGLEGSGLGLAISKRIALLLKGDLFINSLGEGKGTNAIFHFRSF